MNKVVGATIATVAVAGALIITYLDYSTCEYLCGNCGQIYKPTSMRWVSGMHVPTRRHMKCPYCQKWGWHKRIFSS